MFIQRLITSLVLIPCLLALLFWAPSQTVYMVFFAVLMLAAYEWHKLIPLHSMQANGFFVLIYSLSLLSVSYIHSDWIIFLALIWVPIIVFIVLYPSGTSIWARPSIILVLAIVVSNLFAYAMQGIFCLKHGKALILYLFFIVWAADIGAYTFGKLWGKHKLIPLVSPGKSWEGFLGGFFFVTCIALLGAAYFQPVSVLQWYFLLFSCFIVSIFGDLFISVLKRKCKLKDTGNILPGHGGILDRLDSLISTAPIFYAGLIWLNLGIH